MRLSFQSIGAATAICLALTACRTVHSQTEVPAVIVNPTPQSRAALAKAVSEALNGIPVTLADDALTRTNVLIIERAQHRDPNGLLLDGRERGFPEHFELMKTGADCVLVHVGSSRRLVLARTQCSAR